jgi:DNA-binding LytR/AlgR family response regulator
MTTASLRVLVVDDEQLAREELCFLLGQLGGIDVVAQASDGVGALRLAGELTPDLIFLDVQMPGLTGFEVARRLVEADIGAQLVFVTAFDQYAIEAFSVNAVDYVLKPVDVGRLEQTLDRVRRRVASTQAARLPLSAADLERVVEAVQARQGRRDQLAIRVGEKFVLVQASEVIHASLEDDAIVVVTNSASGTSNYRTLDELQARLDPAVFWRVHRSHLVNITKIKEIVPWFSRTFLLKMRDPKATEIGPPGATSASGSISNSDDFAAWRGRVVIAGVVRRCGLLVQAGGLHSGRVQPGRAPGTLAPPSIPGCSRSRCLSPPRETASATLQRVGEELSWFKTLVSAAVYATLIVTFGFRSRASKARAWRRRSRIRTG